MKRIFEIITLLSFILFHSTILGCGEDSNGRTDEERFLLAIEGTWIGTAEFARTISGSTSVVIRLTLPNNDEPALEGLNGTIQFGEENNTSPVDPNNPGIGGEDYDVFRDGYIFDLLDMAIVANRLLARFFPVTQWLDFCEAQTDLFQWDSGMYSCAPDWPCDCYGIEEPCRFTGPSGEEIYMNQGKIALCRHVCRCESTGCTVNINEHGVGVELDFAVDTENGVMLGTGLGRIEAIRQ